MASDMFGWDLLFGLVEKDITSKEDVLVVLVHWYLIKYGFKCTGNNGDERNIESERLPDNWNKDGAYSLKYINNKELYTLTGTKYEGNILFNFLRTSDLAVSVLNFHVDNTVKATKGPIETMIPTHKDMIYKISTELIKPVHEGRKSEAETQTTAETSQRDPFPPQYQDDEERRRAEQRRRPIGTDFDPNWDPSTDPLSVGRSDLDPFGVGGGMLFNPFNPQGGFRQPQPGPVPGGIPRGSIPPGARFDPFGPPGLGPRGGRGGRGGFGAPSPDHFPPPGYDDMFM